MQHTHLKIYRGPVEVQSPVQGDEDTVTVSVGEALPLMITYTLYLWEVNVRAATILGLVGAGGIGLELQTAMRLFLYQELAMIIISLIAMVTVIDQISGFLRRKLI